MRLEPPRHQREEAKSQRRSIFAKMIAGQNMRRDRAGHLEKDPGVSPFPESRDPWPEQSTDCEDLPDADNVQDVGWIADRSHVRYNIREVRQVHEGPRCDLQDEKGSARYVDEFFVHSRLSVMLPDSGHNRYYRECECWLQSLDPISVKARFRGATRSRAGWCASRNTGGVVEIESEWTAERRGFRLPTEYESRKVSG
jgi:hypothetical protein